MTQVEDNFLHDFKLLLHGLLQIYIVFWVIISNLLTTIEIFLCDQFMRKH